MAALPISMEFGFGMDRYMSYNHRLVMMEKPTCIVRSISCLKTKKYAIDTMHFIYQREECKNCKSYIYDSYYQTILVINIR